MMRTRTDENAKLRVPAFLTELSELNRRTGIVVNGWVTWPPEPRPARRAESGQRK